MLAPAPLLALLGLVLLAQAPGLRSQGEADVDPLTLPLERLRLPPGFSAELYTEEHVKSARHMALGLAQGNMTIVYVSSVETGSVSAGAAPAGRQQRAQHPMPGMPQPRRSSRASLPLLLHGALSSLSFSQNAAILTCKQRLYIFPVS